MTDVLRVLGNTLFKAPAHTMLREVRNATGFHRVTRSADALVVSLWPSRGIWFACVEVKTDRRDWLRELKDPDKAEEISRYCDYMWLATTPDIVQEHEIPRTWGLVEVKGTKCRVVKKAPERKPEPLKPHFVAAILRNRGEYEASLRGRVRDELAREAMQAAEPVSRDVGELRALLDGKQRFIENLQRQIADHGRALEEFEQASGVKLTPWDARPIGESVKLAQRFGHNQLEQWARMFEGMAEQTRKAHAELAQLKLPLARDPAKETGT